MQQRERRHRLLVHSSSSDDPSILLFSFYDIYRSDGTIPYDNPSDKTGRMGELIHGYSSVNDCASLM